MRFTPWLVPLFTAALFGLLSACNTSMPSHAYVPMTTARSRTLLQFPPIQLPQCHARAYNAPGTFIVLSSLGTFSGSSFSDSGLSLWASVSLKKGREEIPIIRLPRLPNHYTVYYGTYKLSDGLVGCFYLTKVKYQGISFNGIGVGAPLVYDFGKRTMVAQGPVTVAISGIAGRSGSGTLSLKDAATGKVVNTGSVRISNSIYVP